MIMSRKLLRSLILREAKASLGNLGALLESDLISKMISGKDAKEIASKISDIKNLDSLVLQALKNEKSFKDAISSLDEEKSKLLVGVLGQLRGSLTSSTFNRLKGLISDANPDLKNSMSSM